jgi:hypothetical protein
MVVFTTEVEHSERTHHFLVIVQPADWTKQFPPQGDIVEDYAHPATSQRMSHVERVAKNHNPWTLDWARGQEAVGHAAYSPRLHAVLEGVLNML